MHPHRLRYSSLKYSRYSRSSRLPAGRLARLAATPDFHHGLLRIDDGLTPLLLQVAFGLEAFEFHF